MIKLKTLIKSVAVIAPILAMAAFGGSALQAHEGRTSPPLWEVSDEDTTVYLFGLPNMMDDETEWRSVAFEEALVDAEAIMLESDRQSPDAQAKLQQAITQIGVFRDGTKLTEVVGDATRLQLERVAGSLGLPLRAIDQLKPWLAANQLQSEMVQRQGLLAAPAPTSVILAEAEESETPVSFFEDTRDLIIAVGQLPMDTQVRMLEQSLNTIENQPGEPKRILEQWARGDVDALTEAMHGDDAWVDEAMRTAMLLDRNRAWLKKIEELMQTKTGTIFVAVGIGHLTGEDSLVTGLTRARFAVRLKSD